MSRAFVREDAPDTAPLPDLPVSPHPNHVTPRGLAALQSRLAAAQVDLAAARARTDRLDPLPERIAERDIRHLSRRLATAILTLPPAGPTEVAFATSVTVADEGGQTAIYEIVGEDEADAARGRIAPQSPLARALIGARIGDVVEWRRPNGNASLEVTAIRAIA